MKFILYTLALFLSSAAHAQILDWAFSTGYPSSTHVAALRQDMAGNIFLATNHDSSGAMLSSTIERRDEFQNVMWSQTFTGLNKITDMEMNSFGHPLICGWFIGDFIFGNDTLHSTPDASAFLVELDSSGHNIWTRIFNPIPGSDFKPVDMHIDNFDNIYLTATYSGLSPGFTSFHKLDMWGLPLQDEFNMSSDIRSFSHIIADDNGNVYLSGTCSNQAQFDSLTAPIGSYQNFLVMYDSQFNAQWLITRPYITFDDNNALSYDGLHLYWSFIEANSNADTIKLVKTDLNGQILLDKVGPLAGIFFPGITFTTDAQGNGLFVANIFSRLFLYRFDNQFNQLWNDTLYTSASGFPIDISLACYDSSFYISSKYYNDSLFVGPVLLLNPNAANFGSDLFVARWINDPTLGIKRPSFTTSFSAFPNPTNGIVRLTLKKTEGLLIVRNVLGAIVQNYSISDDREHVIDLSELNNGFYFIQFLEVDGTVLNSEKILLIK